MTDATQEHERAHGGRRRRGPRSADHGGRGRGFGRGGGWQQADLPPAADVEQWFRGRLPEEWFTGTPQVTVDREEILVIGELAVPEHGADAAPADRIARFREDTRRERIAIAHDAERRYGRKVAWGAQLGTERVLFSHLAAPVMTRLRQPERQVLDTLVDAGVARSRSEALAWTVKLAGQHSEKWLSELRDAMEAVERLRSRGPHASAASTAAEDAHSDAEDPSQDERDREP